MNNSSFGIEDIGYTMSVLLEQLCNLNNKMFVLESPLRVNHLINLAVIEYMRMWLQTDWTAQQNLHAFCREKYLPQGQPSVSNEKEPYGNNYNTRYKTLGHFSFEKEMIIRQAKSEDVFINNTRVVRAQPPSYSKLLHFFDLWKIERYNQGQLQILPLLLERKKFLGTTCKKDGNTKLCEACKQYYRIFQGLSKGLSPDGTPMGDVEYVVTALMAHQMEVSYRIHLSVLVAHYMKQKHLLLDPLKPGYCEPRLRERAKNIWSRFKEANLLITPLGPAESIPDMEYCSYSILNYPQMITMYLFAPQEEAKEILAEALLDIILVRTMIYVASAIQPPREIHPWTSQDYQTARKFFETRYLIYDVINQAPIGQNGDLDLEESDNKHDNKQKDTCYDYIRDIQQILVHMGDMEKYNPDSPMREDFQKEAAEFRRVRHSSQHLI